MPATGNISVQTTYNLSDTSETISTPADNKTLKATLAMTDGTAVGQIEGIYRQTVSVGAGATVSLDLKNLIDSLGDALAFTKVLGIAVYNKSLTDIMSIGGNAAGIPIVNPVTGKILVGKAQSATLPTPLVLTDPEGIAITVTTADQLDINSEGASGGDVDIVIWGQTT